MNETKTFLANFFLDFFNNYLTMEKFANDKGLTQFEAQRLINIGRKYHNQNAEKLKKQNREDIKLLNKLKTPVFYFEMTDLFGGELNYSWVNKYAIEAKTFKSAQIRLGKEVGFNFNFDGIKYKAKGGAIAYTFLEYGVSEEWMKTAILL